MNSESGVGTNLIDYIRIKLNMNTYKYYEELKEKGAHKRFFDPLAKYKEKLWMSLAIISALLLLRLGIFDFLSFWGKLTLGMFLFALFKLGEIWGHREGFIDGHSSD